MSRIGKKPIPIVSGVKVTQTGQTVNVEGPLGKLNFTHRPEVSVKIEADNVTVERRDDERMSRGLHGLTRTLIANMIEGVSKGFMRSLELYGVGFGVQLQGKKFTINC